MARGHRGIEEERLDVALPDARGRRRCTVRRRERATGVPRGALGARRPRRPVAEVDRRRAPGSAAVSQDRGGSAGMTEPERRVDPEHPWPALLAFVERDQEFFGGRREEVEALFRRLVASRLTLLFGLSGIGKSSLLRAGLFPRLRASHYFPVYIRLRFG